jgi:hypothetical protein
MIFLQDSIEIYINKYRETGIVLPRLGAKAWIN